MYCLSSHPEKRYAQALEHSLPRCVGADTYALSWRAHALAPLPVAVVLPVATMQDVVCASLGACTQQLLAAAVSPGAPGSRLLLVSFTDAGGLTMALNWALHLRRAGVTPVVGLDGPMPSKWGSASEDAAWRSVRPVLFLAGASAARNGYERWRLRWDVVGQLLALGTDVMMSDTDVVWLRDPRPYVRALITRHPLLDVLLGTGTPSNSADH